MTAGSVAWNALCVDLLLHGLNRVGGGCQSHERRAALLAELGPRVYIMAAVTAALKEPNATCFTELCCITIGMLTLGTRHVALPPIKG